MSILNGKLHRRIRVQPTGLNKVSSPYQALCPLCGGGIEWVTSTLAKVKTGMGSKWVEDKEHPSIVYDDQGEPHTEFAMKRIKFPLLSTLRICHRPDCQKKITEIVPEWDKNTLRLPERDLSRTRSTNEAGEKPIDPSWMTARGKRL